MSETHQIGSDALSATISSHGAELVSLKDSDGVELLWQAGPEWPRHAPILFPTVGKLTEDALRVGEESYHVTQHGFARDLEFEWGERSDAAATLRLTDSEETRARFPFAFILDMSFRVDGDALSVVSRVGNPGADVLPFCIGAHPGFRWPLVEGLAKEDHVIEFERREFGPKRSVDGGLLGAEAPLPFDGVTLPLSQELFAHDALVMPGVSSRAVRYAAIARDGSTIRALRVSWRNYEDLGIWSAPAGAPFLCIEPWRGMASSVGWDGQFMQKPGVVRLERGSSIEFEWRVEI